MADGATVAVISQLSTMSIFTMDTNIFKLHSSTLFLVGVLQAFSISFSVRKWE